MTQVWPFGELPMFGYDFIMADPHWRFETWSEKGRLSKGPDRHYQTAEISKIIKEFPIGYLASKTCLLWLWATHPMIDQQICAGRAWGFKFVTSGVWVKRTKHGKLAFGNGYRLRSASEPFVLFTMGNPETTKSVRTVIEGPVREHSRKPDEAYQEAERLMPAAERRLDLFSRETRPGWEAFGDEAGKFDQEAA
ncbi:MAG: DNA methyltransferase [Roseibium sp.]|nr:DNA methyltransferase [Roseibium sp.]